MKCPTSAARKRLTHEAFLFLEACRHKDLNFMYMYETRFLYRSHVLEFVRLMLLECASVRDSVRFKLLAFSLWMTVTNSADQLSSMMYIVYAQKMLSDDEIGVTPLKWKHVEKVYAHILRHALKKRKLTCM